MMYKMAKDQLWIVGTLDLRGQQFWTGNKHKMELSAFG